MVVGIALNGPIDFISVMVPSEVVSQVKNVRLSESKIHYNMNKDIKL